MNTGKVNIHGREYKTVALRVSEFREQCPAEKGWSILTEIVDRNDQSVVIKAEIRSPDGLAVATGYAEEQRKASQINRTSALENCETSAIGRALAAFGLGGSEYASAGKLQHKRPFQPVANQSHRLVADGVDAQRISGWNMKDANKRPTLRLTDLCFEVRKLRH